MAAETRMQPYSQAQEASRTDGQTLNTFEAFCDILVSPLATSQLVSIDFQLQWENKACPVNGMDGSLILNVLIYANIGPPPQCYTKL